MAKILRNHVKERLQVILLIFFLSSCNTDWRVIQSHFPTIPLYPISPAPSQLLLLNAYDVPAQKFREGKEELFINLLNTMLSDISKQVSDRSGINSEVIYGTTKTENPDSTVKTLMNQYNASHAIVITFFNIYFDQTRVDVTKDSNGTSRVAFYDIVSEINYSLYDEKGVPKDMKIMQRRFHSSRAVLSGLLAVGPDIVFNGKDASDLARDNLVEYLNNFFPGWEARPRTIFVGKELGTVREAVKSGDYESAMKECLRFVNYPDKELAAIANYNCAVFLEKKNQPDEAKSYLEQSLRLYSLPVAGSMMSDYGLNK